MIPYTLLQCKVNRMDTRIVDCSIFHFEFRVPDPLNSIQEITISFYNGKNYDNVSIHDFVYTLSEQNEFYYTYRVETEEESYVASMRKLQEEIQKYTSFKLKEEQERYIKYPLELDEIYPKSKKDLLEILFKDLRPEPGYKELLSRIQLGICLENPLLVDTFLELDWKAFKDYYFEQACLDQHPIQNVEVKYLYIGNQFCEHLLPEKDKLIAILKKCQSCNIRSVIVFPPMKEHLISKYKEIVKLADEVVINDLGMAFYLKDSSVRTILGVLLNKHLKDPRMKYMDLNLRHFTQIENSLDYKLSYESCGYTMEYKKGSDFYFPKYQTNTAGMCTMYAKCHNGNRAYQQEVMDCPKYCLSQHFLYPVHLQILGEYNSVFGYDVRILKDYKYLEEIVESGIERMIVSV